MIFFCSMIFLFTPPFFFAWTAFIIFKLAGTYEKNRPPQKCGGTGSGLSVRRGGSAHHHVAPGKPLIKYHAVFNMGPRNGLRTVKHILCLPAHQMPTDPNTPPRTAE